MERCCGLSSLVCVFICDKGSVNVVCCSYVDDDDARLLFFLARLEIEFFMVE